ncbi:hypothetical protein CPB85DRAFT_222081 [Mucidula mucida]|nr:hypothetical protein CPB85DRAFT_222081 [Mucidula mucida]
MATIPFNLSFSILHPNFCLSSALFLVFLFPSVPLHKRNQKLPLQIILFRFSMIAMCFIALPQSFWVASFSLFSSENRAHHQTVAI